MAGGQATNSGINYQQRIAAWCLINQYIGFDMSQFLENVSEEIIIEKTHFETDRPIDDIQLSCKNNKFVYLQIKRKISLSIEETSDLYKTFEQFVVQHLKQSPHTEYYGLVITSDSSSKITSDLKKISAAMRLNDDALNDNPLNASETYTLSKIKNLLLVLFKKNAPYEATDEDLKTLLKKLFISVIDIEAGNSVEIATIMLLRGVGFRNPVLIWSLMISNALGYASKRLSVDTKKLDEIFKTHLNNEQNKSTLNISEDFKTEIISSGNFQVARDFLLIESFMPEFDLMFIELFRFTSDCQRKNTFSNGYVKIARGEKWKIIQRFATNAGFERYLEEKGESLKGGKMAMIPAGEDSEAETGICAKLHREHIESLILQNSDMLCCLHCGKPVNPEEGLIIEIDDLESAPAFGNAHNQCIRPVDRIMGRFKFGEHNEDPYLSNFDFKLWVSLILKGQGLMNHLRSNPLVTQGRRPIISWNSTEEYDNDNSYCIRFTLEDGSSSYAYQRGKIERLNKTEAMVWQKRFQETLEKRKKENDPYCVLSISKDAGQYSQLLLIKKKGEKILEIKNIEVARYSLQIAKLFDRDLSYYAPLCLIRDRDTEQIFTLSNVVPIISDPLSLSDFFDNWNSLDFPTKNLELKIIKTDHDFDSQLRMIFRDGFIPLLDPIFDKNFTLVSGYPIRKTDDILAEAENHQADLSSDE